MGVGDEERLVWQNIKNALYWAHLECVFAWGMRPGSRTLGLTEQREAGPGRR